MPGLRTFLLIGLAVLGAYACGDDDDGSNGGGGESVAALCAMGCEKGASLSCPNEPSDCPGQCEAEINQIDACAMEARAYLGCAANRPTSDFMCDEDGESAVVDTVCTTEANMLSTCILGSIGGGAGASGGAGAGGGAGGGSEDCPFTNDGECDEGTFCAPGTDTADCGG